MEKLNRLLYVLLMLGMAGCDQKDPASTDQQLVIARVSGNGQEGRLGRALALPLVILVTNKQGIPVANQRVDFEVIEGKGQLSVESTVTSAEGQASTRLTLGKEEGAIKVRASVFGSESAVEFTAVALTAPPPTTGSEETPSLDAVNVLRLDGSGDWVRVPVLTRDNPLSYPGSGGWSLEVWAKPAALQSTAVLCGQASINDSPKDPYYLDIGDGSYSDTGGGSFKVQDNLGNVTWSGRVPPFEEVGHWTHLAGTYEPGTNKNTLRFYVNGELKSQSEVTVSIGSRASAGDPFAIGSLASYGGEAGFVPFAGDIDEVRVWSRTLTQEEIQASMYSALSGAEVDLVGYWNFSGLTIDGKVPDLTGNDNEGILLFDAHLAYSADTPVP